MPIRTDGPNRSENSHQRNIQKKDSRLQKNIFTRITGLTIGISGVGITAPVVAVGALASISVGLAAGIANKIQKAVSVEKIQPEKKIVLSAKKTAVATFKTFAAPGFFFSEVINKSISSRPSKQAGRNPEMDVKSSASMIEVANKVASPVTGFAGEKILRKISPFYLSFESMKPVSSLSVERLASEKIVSDPQRSSMLRMWKNVVLAEKYVEERSPVKLFLSEEETSDLKLIENYLKTHTANITSSELGNEISDVQSNEGEIDMQKIEIILNRQENRLESFLEVALNEIERGLTGESVLHAKYLGKEGLKLSEEGLNVVVEVIIHSLNDIVAERDQPEFFRDYLKQTFANTKGISEKRDLTPTILVGTEEKYMSIRNRVLSVINDKTGIDPEYMVNNQDDVDENMKKLVAGLCGILNGQSVEIPKLTKMDVKNQDVNLVKKAIVKNLELENARNIGNVNRYLEQTLNAMLKIDFDLEAEKIAEYVQVNEKALEQDQKNYVKENIAAYFNPSLAKADLPTNFKSANLLKFPPGIDTDLKRKAYLTDLAKNMVQYVGLLEFRHNKKNFEIYVLQLFENLYGVNRANFPVELTMDFLTSHSRLNLTSESYSEECKTYFTEVFKSLSNPNQGLRPKVPPSPLNESGIHESILSIKVEPKSVKENDTPVKKAAAYNKMLEKEAGKLANELLEVCGLPGTDVNRTFLKECLKELNSSGFRKQAELNTDLLLRECMIGSDQISDSDHVILKNALEELLDPMQTARPVFLKTFQTKATIPSEVLVNLTTPGKKEQYFSSIALKFINRLVEEGIIAKEDRYFATQHVKEILFELHGFEKIERHEAVLEKRNRMSDIMRARLEKFASGTESNEDTEIKDYANHIDYLTSKIADFTDKKGDFKVTGYTGKALKLDIEESKPKSWYQWASSGISGLLFAREDDKNPVEAIDKLVEEIHAEYMNAGLYIGSSSSEIKKVKKQIARSLYEMFGYDRRARLARPYVEMDLIHDWTNKLSDSIPSESTKKKVEKHLKKIVKELQFSSINGRMICPIWPYGSLEFAGFTRDEMKTAADMGIDLEKMIIDLATDLMTNVGEHFPEYEQCRNLLIQSLSQIYGIPVQKHFPEMLVRGLGIDRFASAIGEDLEKYLTSEIAARTEAMIDLVVVRREETENAGSTVSVENLLENHVLGVLSRQLALDVEAGKFTQISFNGRQEIDQDDRYQKSVQAVDRLLSLFLPGGPEDISIPEMEITQQVIAELVSASGINYIKDLSQSVYNVIKPALDLLGNNNRSRLNLSEKFTDEISPEFVSVASSKSEQISNKIFQEIPDKIGKTILSTVDKKIDAKLDYLKSSKGIDLHEAVHGAIDVLGGEGEDKIGKAYQVLVYHAIRRNMINKLFDGANKLDDPVQKMKVVSMISKKVSNKVTGKKATSAKKSDKKKTKKKAVKIKTSINAEGTQAYIDFCKNLIISARQKPSRGKMSKKIEDTTAEVVGKIVQQKVNKLIKKNLLEDIFHSSVEQVLTKVGHKTGDIATAKIKGKQASMLHEDNKELFEAKKQEFEASKKSLKKFSSEKLPIVENVLHDKIDDLFEGIESTVDRLMSGDMLLEMVGELTNFGEAHVNKTRDV